MALASTAQALYFYIDGASSKCFYEELPKGTLVAGTYSSEEYDDRIGAWQQHSGLNIFISVDVCAPKNNHHLRVYVTCTN